MKKKPVIAACVIGASALIAVGSWVHQKLSNYYNFHGYHVTYQSESREFRAEDMAGGFRAVEDCSYLILHNGIVVPSPAKEEICAEIKEFMEKNNPQYKAEAAERTANQPKESLDAFLEQFAAKKPTR